MEKSLLAEEASEEPAWCAFLTLRPGSFEGVLVSSKPCRYEQDPIGWKDVVLVRVFFFGECFLADTSQSLVFDKLCVRSC
jgi:hypothetical protein